MLRYQVGGRTAATAATTNHAYCALWNPSASRKIFVLEIHIVKTVGTVDNHDLARISARGTPGSTVTPVSQNSDDNAITPVSGALLDLAAYSVQPTISLQGLRRFNLPAVVGAGLVWIWPEPGIAIVAGQGLAILTPVAVIGQPSDVTFVFQDS